MPPRHSARRWLVWGVAVTAYVVAVLGRSSLSATGVAAAERFAVSSGVLSLLAVLQLAVYAALQIPAGILVDRLGPRRLIAGGAVLVALGQAVLAVSTSMPVAVVGRVLVGAGDAVTFVSVLRLIPSWFPARQVPVVNQMSGILGQLGQVASAVPLAGLVASSGWTPAYLSAAGLGVLVAVLAVAVLRDGTAAPAPVPAGGFGEVWRNPGTRLGWWCHFASPFPGNTFGLLWGFPFLTAGEGLASSTASGLLTVYVLAGIATGPVFGALAGRFPSRRPLLIGAAVVVQALAWLGVLAWPGPAPTAVLALLAVLLGLGGPASLVAFDVARSAVGPAQVGRASGLVNVGGFVSSLVVVLMVGVALDLQGAGTPDTYTLEAFRVAMLVQVPVWIVGLVGMWLAARRVRRAASGPARGVPSGA